MGLFSKKDYVCAECGKTFTKRINLNGNLCDECDLARYNKKIEEENARYEIASKVRGYEEYGKKVLNKTYTIDELNTIIEFRNAIITKYTNTYRVSEFDLAYAAKFYKSLSAEEIAIIIEKIKKSSYTTTTGAVHTANFFMPTNYPGTIVDAKDVFAVAYTQDANLRNMSDSKHEDLLCVLFTNDPYMPVFSMKYTARLGFFEIFKSKKGREELAKRFEILCPNLTYSVCDIKELKKQIKLEEKINGNLSREFVFRHLDDAAGGWGIHNTSKMTKCLLKDSQEIIEDMGYMTFAKISQLLELNDVRKEKFWREQFEITRL